MHFFWGLGVRCIFGANIRNIRKWIVIWRNLTQMLNLQCIVVLALWRSENNFWITMNMLRYCFFSTKSLKNVWNLQQSQLFPGTLNLAPVWFAKKDLVFNIHKICSSNSNNWISILTQYTDANVLKFSCHWMIEWKLNFNPPMSLNPFRWIYQTWKKRKY